MKTDCLKGIDTLRYSDIFLAMYSDNGSSCLHRNHSHVLVYMYSGELEIKEHKKITRLHKGDCAFIRKDFSVQLTKQACKMEQFKAVFLMFTDKFLRNFYCRLDKESLPENARRSKVSLYVLLNTDKNLYASRFDFADPWKIDIMDFMEQNYMNDLTLAEMANYTGRSLATFKRDFNKVSDLSPQKWVIRRRLEAAHALILSGTRKVTDVCYRVGFKNLSHFSKAYKGLYGYSPAHSN